MKFKTPSEIKIIFMGTPEIAVPCLEQLIEEGYDVVAVISQPDKEVGRKRKLTPSPVKTCALNHNIPVFQPAKITNDFEWINDFKPDAIITMAYGQIVPQALLDIPSVGCFNMHGSLLPKLRGAAPIQRAIMQGMEETGVTLMEMVDKMDAGKMYSKVVCEIKDDDTYTTLCEKISEGSQELVKNSLMNVLNGNNIGVPQNEEEVTFANKILKNDEKLPLNLTCFQTIRYIHGISEEPGAFVIFEDKKLKIFKARIFSNNVERRVGEIVPNKKHFILQLKDGQIELLEVQLAGKNKNNGRDFIQGARIGEHAFIE